MDRYFFHVRRGRVTFLDNEGIELADLEEAAQEAARRAWQIEAREALTVLPPSGGMIIVDDEFRTVLELPFEGGHKGSLA
jgi:hypothetical protein